MYLISSSFCPVLFFRVGLFGKLQRVMQDEKERELEFVKNLNAELEISKISYSQLLSVIRYFM